MRSVAVAGGRMSLNVLHITKRFGERTVVHGVTFRVDDGELVALLGPSGSGKSTLLRIVAGLTTCDSGRVEVDDQEVTDLPPQARDLGFVFQNYALFEHLSVADNIEFALRVRGMAKADRVRRRDELLEQVGLGGSARKFPAQLSGGQRQRTALARALAHRPRLLLLDEPFGALDAQIRQELRQGLRELLKQLNTTAVFVTHDQEEAFAVADRIMILHRGRLLEQGPPEQLYHSPNTEFVARFVGRANVLPGEMTPDGVRVRLGTAAHPDALHKRVKVLFRPERLELYPPQVSNFPRDAIVLTRDARVQHIEYLGANERIELAVQTEGGEIAVPNFTLNVMRGFEQRPGPRLQRGDRMTVVGRQPHAITQPSLRVLILADDVPGDLAALEQLLTFGEREQAIFTVIGRAVNSIALAPRLERSRQSFAGDLKLIDAGDPDASLLESAGAQLSGERFDLVSIAPSLLAQSAWFELLRLSGVRHVLLPAPVSLPLLSAGQSQWSLLVRQFCSARPDLGLVGELAQAARARVVLHDMGGMSAYGEMVERSLSTLPQQAAKSKIAGLRSRRLGATAHGEAVQLGGDLLIADLGPRSLLMHRHLAWLEPLRDRWMLLLIQPDEVDFDLDHGLHGPAHPVAQAVAVNAV